MSEMGGRADGIGCSCMFPKKKIFAYCSRLFSVLMSVSIVSCKQNPSGENAHFIGH
jgi:hypothetical protein